MTELVAKLQELQSLPPELHWFCSNWTPDDNAASDFHPVKTEYAIGQDLRLRQDQAAECLTLYSYDDALTYQEQLREAIDKQLGRCDACIEEYYKAKKRLIDSLRHDYEEEVVLVLSKAFDHRDIERIKRGLDNVSKVLKATEPALRDKNRLHLSSQLALFEALSNKAFLADDTLLAENFQEPFTLVQTNKRLRIVRYVPAATSFLFDADHDRRNWATLTWSKYQNQLTKEDFDFAIREPLLENMKLVFESVTDPSTLERTWYGIGLIVNNLNNDLVTHSLRAMEIDVFMLALDHLKYEVPGFRYLVETIGKLLGLAPKDFWDSMGAISPTTFIEQIFNNGQFDTFMEESKENDVNEPSPLRDMLSWIKPFMASLETVHQARACRSLSFQLLKRLQAERFPVHAKVECYRIGLKTLTWTLTNCHKEGATLSPIGRVVAGETLEVVSEHINQILKLCASPSSSPFQETCGEFCQRIIKVSLALECKALRTDQEALKQGKEVPAGYSSYAPAIWDAVVLNMDRGNMPVARAALIGINDLTGLEKFKVNIDESYTKEKSGYNVKLGRLTHLVCQILERINDFTPDDLDKLFRHSDTATALVASLFAPDASLYEAGVNLIKSISFESARREAIGHLLSTFFDTTLNAFSWSIRRIGRNKNYAPCPRMLKTSADALDVLCDSQNGLLRTKSLSGLAEIKAVENFWENQWDGLRVIYETTEDWGRAKVDDSNTLKEFCRDTMQFSERFFDQYSLFASAIDSAVKARSEDSESETAGKELLKHPAAILEAVVKWLRLKDLFLVDISVALSKKILNRLTDMDMTVAEGPSEFLEQVINNGPRGRTLLTLQQKAELARALEANLGRTISLQSERTDSETFSDRSREPLSKIKRKTKPGVIDLDTWRSKAKASEHVVEISDDDEFNDADFPDQEMLSVGRSVELMKKMKAAQATLPSNKRGLPIHDRKAVAPLKHDKALSKVPKPGPIQSDADRALFREKRDKEREAKKKRDAETLAMVKRKAVGIAGQTLGEGSGLGGIGVKGKDHAPKGPSLMVSSGSDSDSDDDLDESLFGNASKLPKVSSAVREYQANRTSQAGKGPIKKMRVVRSAKDMRARLAPDLTALHKTILSWEFFHDGDFPPGSERNDYSLVTNKFRTPVDYQNCFQPLLILEAWQGFLKSKEEGNFKAFEIKVANRMTVDSFLEVSTTMSMAEGKELAIGEADIILLSKGQSPANDAEQPHCLARVYKITRKKGTMEITYRANVGNALVTSLVPNVVLHGTKVASITPLEREYGALLGLKYFDLCDEIIKGKPSPLLSYSEKQLNPLLSTYGINTAQAKAVRSALDNDAFTLVQGPPGSGKTKTIVAIVGALLTSSFADRGVSISRPQASNGQTSRASPAPALKKLLVCAPSNAAVDELVMRFKQGITTLTGEHQDVSILRLGRSDAINANVLDVTLEELVKAKLNITSGKKVGSGEDIGKIMQAHKATCEEFNALRNSVDESKAKGKPVSPDQTRQFEVLKRRKQQLSNQIDTARDSGDTAARDAEISRRRVQQEVIDGARVICATLSGSGHEMFQGLNIEFETVIIDEAAQSIELSALIPLKYGCSKCILVGDPKQLPPTVLSREAARFQYEQSLFVRMQVNNPHDVHLLDTQYRMHPEISLFPSRSFYDSKLLDGPNMDKLRAKPWHQSKILGPYRFFDVQGTHQNAPKGHSLINLAEIEIALSLYNRLITDCKGYNFQGKIGIITPYKSQLRELRSRFAQRYGEIVLTHVEFNTTDAFQGRESEVIIFSCVRASLSKGIGFLSDIRRMNVGITRAKSSLWVLGNSRSLIRGEFWGQLIRDAQSRDRYTDGDLVSMLRKPLLDMGSQTALAIKDDTDMPDAPLLANSAMNSRRSSSVATPVDGRMPDDWNTGSFQPSGGSNGLNQNGNCQICGSFSHWTNRCDNLEALEQAKGRCYRCGEVGHNKTSCEADRCLVCGDIGHKQETCTSTNPLSNKERERIGRQEIERRMILARKPELQRRRQLGDHDRSVPVVRSTSPTPPPETEMRKRKRQSSSSNGPALLPKAPNENYGLPPKPTNPSSHGIHPARKQPNTGKTGYSGSADPRTSSQATSSAFPNSSAHSSIQHARNKPDQSQKISQGTTPERHDLPARPTQNPSIIRVGQGGSSLPRPPPQQNIVRPPKRKKDADPFIRPKKR